jgi:fatty acid desaturase
MSTAAAPDLEMTVADSEYVTPESSQNKSRRVKWYRCKLTREQMSELNRKSDVLGFMQTGGYLAVLAATATLSVYSAHHWPWYTTVLLLYLHGTVWQFLINGFHELIHDSVFRTRWLNGFFLRIFSFLGWYNHHHFWASHTEHHKFTLHPPDDLEVTLPYPNSVSSFIRSAVVDPWMLWIMLKDHALTACGQVKGQWTEHLFPVSDPQARRKLRNWARLVLVGHGLIVSVSVAMGWWFVPVVVTFAPFYGGALHYLLNRTQHAGLVDNVPDFRLCCRTIRLNPVFQFLYWHMNYHTEHHMYAGVPCYRLGKLHRLIRHEMPYCPNGIIATWRQIIGIHHAKRRDPSYRYLPELPTGPGATVKES